MVGRLSQSEAGFTYLIEGEVPGLGSRWRGAEEFLVVTFYLRQDYGIIRRHLCTQGTVCLGWGPRRLSRLHAKGKTLL